MAYTLGPQMQDVTFLKTSFSGQTNFTVVWYLASNNSLPSNNGFLSKVMQSQSTVHQKGSATFLHWLFILGNKNNYFKPKLLNVNYQHLCNIVLDKNCCRGKARYLRELSWCSKLGRKIPSLILTSENTNWHLWGMYYFHILGQRVGQACNHKAAFADYLAYTSIQKMQAIHCLENICKLLPHTQHHIPAGRAIHWQKIWLSSFQEACSMELVKL